MSSFLSSLTYSQLIMPGVQALSCSEQSGFLLATLRQQCGVVTGIRWTVLDGPSTASESSQVIGTLSQTFLGQGAYYWMNTIGTPAKQKKEMYQFLSGYTGPHAIVLVVENEDEAVLRSCNIVVHKLPELCDAKELSSIAQLLGLNYSLRKLTHLGSGFNREQLPCDVVCSLLLHLEYAPMRIPDQTVAYLQRLLPHNSSLVTLADLFFKQQYGAFFQYWDEVYEQYGEMFWLSFWLDQVWRAYYVRLFMQQRKEADAKKMGYRLPRAFVTHGWRSYTPAQFLAMYEQLYFFDTRVKRGSLFALHDLFCTSTFSGPSFLREKTE